MQSQGPVQDSGHLGDLKRSNAQKHQFIRNSLLELISTIDDGESLPPERALSERLGAARMTVRKALDLLIDEGYLRRIAGKGTFVTRSHALHANSMEPFAHFSVDGISAAQGKTLEIVQEDTGSRIGLRLQLAPSASVTKVVRVCLVDEEPVAIERLYLPSHIFPNLTAEHFTIFDVNELYRSEFGVKVAQSSQVLRAATVDQAESKLLGVPVHSPAFFVTTTKTDQDDRVVEYTEAVYRGDKYRFYKVTGIDSNGEPSSSTAHRGFSNSHFIIS
jgi:GntR family transcriptional regulator